jgi:hypothetical protein
MHTYPMTEAERRTTIAKKLRLGLLRWRPPGPPRDERRLETMRLMERPEWYVCSGCDQRLVATDSGRGSIELRYELATFRYDAICFDVWQQERAKILQL